MPLISDDAVTINSIPMTDYASSATPTTPSSGKSRIFTRSDGLYWLDDAGATTGPLAVAGTGAAADGWAAAGETWTYASADDPTFTFTVAADVTTKYSAGMRIKLTQTTVKYFIITAVSAYSAPNTTITVYGGTDYDLANAAITLPYYSTSKAPQGFPIDPAKWTVEVTDTSSRVQATPTQNQWYNPGSITISIPIGVWRVYYKAISQLVDASTAAWIISITLSTANNSESDISMSCRTTQGSIATISMSNYTERFLTLASKTSYYLNLRTESSGADNIYIRGDVSTTIIRAVCAYL